MVAHEIITKQISWDQAAHVHLDGVGGYTADQYHQDIKFSDATLFGIFENGNRVASAVMDWSTPGKGVCTGLGGHAENAISTTVIGALEAMARQVKNVKTVEFVTKRPGLIRSLARLNQGREFSVSWAI
jgi:hypothetical protein